MAKQSAPQIVSLPPEQTLRLVQAFSAIPDYHDRELIISFVEGIAEGQEQQPGSLARLLTIRQ